RRDTELHQTLVTNEDHQRVTLWCTGVGGRGLGSTAPRDRDTEESVWGTSGSLDKDRLSVVVLGTTHSVTEGWVSNENRVGLVPVVGGLHQAEQVRELVVRTGRLTVPVQVVVIGGVSGLWS